MKPRFGFADGRLVGLVLLVSIVGSLMVVDTSYAASIARGEGMLSKQVLVHLGCAGIGFLMAWGLALVGPRTQMKLGWVALVLSYVVAVFLVGFFGVEQNGAKSWIEVSGVRIQPSEFAKVGLIAFLASILAHRKAFVPTGKLGGMANWLDHVALPSLRRFFPFALALGVAGYISIQDLGTGAIVTAIVLSMMFVGNVRRAGLAGLVLVLLISAVGYVKLEDYRWQRFARHYARWEDHNVSDIGYQTTQSELVQAQGGAFGVGAGDGRLKHILPAATNDFVFGTIGEEFGLAGSLCVIVLLASLVVRLLQVSFLAPDRYGTLFCAGMASWIAVQSSVNILMANGSIPAVGVPLPFFSAGGSSVLALWMGFGFALGSLRDPALVREKRKKVSTGAKRSPSVGMATQ